MLIEQTYPGRSDYVNHFFAILDALTDGRYITVDGKPLVVILKPEQIPDSRMFADCWRELAHSVGLKDLYLVANHWLPSEHWTPAAYGYDAACVNLLAPAWDFPGPGRTGTVEVQAWRLARKVQAAILHQPRVIDYEHAIQLALCELPRNGVAHPIIYPNWDNTPRSGAYGNLFHGSTPELFRRLVRHALQLIEDKADEQRLLFIKSWNEWAEGNYLEPDVRFGHGYLQVLRDELCRSESSV
jgi:hypothetical protein